MFVGFPISCADTPKDVEARAGSVVAKTIRSAEPVQMHQPELMITNGLTETHMMDKRCTGHIRTCLHDFLLMSLMSRTVMHSI